MLQLWEDSTMTTTTVKKPKKVKEPMVLPAYYWTIPEFIRVRLPRESDKKYLLRMNRFLVNIV